MLNDPQALLLKNERRYTEAYIEGIGDTVRFRSLSAGELLDVQAAKTQREARLLPLVWTICNEDGRLIYTPDDVDALSQVDGRIVDALLDVINAHCVNRESVDSLVRAAEKNSPSGPGD